MIFNIYVLNRQWNIYHTNPLSHIRYDYAMELAFKNIDISPEQTSEKQIIREAKIKDGYRYATNSDGQVIRDSLGNKIKIDKFKTIKSNFYQFTQFKSAMVTGVVNFIDLTTKQRLDKYSLASEFIFKHSYANYDGDM